MVAHGADRIGLDATAASAHRQRDALHAVGLHGAQVPAQGLCAAGCRRGAHIIEVRGKGIFDHHVRQGAVAKSRVPDRVIENFVVRYNRLGSLLEDHWLAGQRHPAVLIVAPNVVLVLVLTTGVSTEGVRISLEESGTVKRRVRLSRSLIDLHLHTGVLWAEDFQIPPGQTHCLRAGCIRPAIGGGQWI